MATSSNFGSLNVASSLMQSSTDRAMQSVRSAGVTDQSAKIQDAKIEKGAHDFESILMGSWLQQAEQSFATLPGSEDDENAASREQTMSFGVQSLSSAMAANGGIGIAKMVAKAMHAQADKASAAKGQAAQTQAQSAPTQTGHGQMSPAGK